MALLGVAAPASAQLLLLDRGRRELGLLVATVEGIEALEKFAALDKQKAELVKLRYFVGMTIEEAAEVLGISAATAKRYWAYARAWLFREISRQKSSSV